VDIQKTISVIWNPPRRGHATEQVQSPRDKFIAHECEGIAFQKISEWAAQQDNRRFYNEPALLKHKQMFDIMIYNKEGFVKEFTFIAWCRKVHKLKIEAASTALNLPRSWRHDVSNHWLLICSPIICYPNNLKRRSIRSAETRDRRYIRHECSAQLD
jgi:hypothetical protein